MKITSETQLVNFNFWSGAKTHNFTHKELIQLDFILTDILGDEVTETQINDLFWFETDYLCECIGLDVEEYEER